MFSSFVSDYTRRMSLKCSTRSSHSLSLFLWTAFESRVLQVPNARSPTGDVRNSSINRKATDPQTQFSSQIQDQWRQQQIPNLGQLQSNSQLSLTSMFQLSLLNPSLFKLA